MLRLLFILFLLSVTCISFCQEPKLISKKLSPVSSDCSHPIVIKLSKSTVYGPTVAPADFGKQKEISGNKKSKYYFEEEHHSAWYAFSIPVDGDLVFEIVPEDINDDYDFLLFKYTDSTFCEQVNKKKLVPVRTNISRNNKELKSITGLSMDAKDSLIHEGIASPFSKYLKVKKGEKYILVLDNVYENGKGHTIEFGYKKEIEISGTVINDDSIPMKAEITLEDKNGKEIIKTVSDDKTGKYNLNTFISETQNYSLTIYSDSGFLQTKIINTDKKEKLNDIKTVLPKLKGGKKYILGNINFFGNLSILIPSSTPSVKALYKLMEKNKKMVIQIEGHTNGCSGGIDFVQRLSENRAKAVADSLFAKGIPMERVSIIGYNCKYMLFPNAKNEYEMEQNRRVEVKVISIK